MSLQMKTSAVIALFAIQMMVGSHLMAAEYKMAINEDRQALRYNTFCIRGVEYLVASRSPLGSHKSDPQLVMSPMYTPEGRIATCVVPKYSARQ